MQKIINLLVNLLSIISDMLKLKKFKLFLLHKIMMFFLITSSGLILSACSDQKNIKDWMKQQKEGTVVIPQIQAPAPQSIVEYKPNNSIDPFGVARAVDPSYLRKEENENKNNLALKVAEVARENRANPLESLSLSEIKMVGYMNSGKRLTAMVQADGNIYGIHVGDPLGNNFGIVKAVKEESVIVQETIKDGNGKLVQRESVLSMNDQGGKTR